MKFLLGALAILVLLCSFLGYKTYDLSEENATLSVAPASAQEALKASQTPIKQRICPANKTTLQQLNLRKRSPLFRISLMLSQKR